LQWDAASGEGSREYAIVEQIVRRTPSVLLLTATPEQLGESSHFARLRLLDPERFHGLCAYLEEHSQYEEIAEIGGKLIQGEELAPIKRAELGKILNIPAEELKAELAFQAGRESIVKRLLDQHGTGRVMFRNTRAAMAGFPKRIAALLPLQLDSKERIAELEEEFETDADPHAPRPPYDFDDDPRIIALAEFLRADPDRKVLLLCRYLEKVEMIEGALRGRMNVKAAVFHEKLPLIQRDRNAAWFAEEDGAQILICSEIGSEGRNFQFAHHLVLFDLPLDPDLLEQRIGRLDRIGQTEDIHIHVPYVVGSPQEVLARWYHEGVNAFEQHFSGGAELGARFREDLLKAASGDEGNFDHLVEETKVLRKRLEAKLHSGRDRLLEMHSFNPARAAQTIEQIAAFDADTRLDRFVSDAFDHFGLSIEELENRTFNLGGGDLFHDKIPALPEEGLAATADRARALSRENIGFLTWDHPIVTSLLDMLLGSEQGNTAFALWPGAPEGGVIVEAIYVVEAQAPPALQLDRFLPPTPLRIVLNHKRKELGAEASPEILATALKNGDPAVLAEQLEEFGTLLPGMIRVTEIIAGKQSKPILEAAAASARDILSGEITRLEQLREVNRSVRADEIDTARAELTSVLEALAKGAPRLDSLRLILASGSAAAK
jgi:ATP-dependent helicase HepA